MILVCFQSNQFNIRVIQVYAPTTDAEAAEVEWFYDDLQKKRARFIIRNWNTKGGSEQMPGVTGKFGHGVQKEAKQRLTEFYQENTLFIANTPFTTQEITRHEHHQMVNTEIRLIIFFAAKDG